MRRRGFLKAMVAAAVGAIAIPIQATKKVLSTKDGTLKPGWAEGQQKLWAAQCVEDEEYGAIGNMSRLEKLRGGNPELHITRDANGLAIGWIC